MPQGRYLAAYANPFAVSAVRLCGERIKKGGPGFETWTAFLINKSWGERKPPLFQDLIEIASDAAIRVAGIGPDAGLFLDDFPLPVQNHDGRQPIEP